MGTSLIAEWVIKPEEIKFFNIQVLADISQSQFYQRSQQSCLGQFTLVRPRKLDQAGIDGVGEHRSKYCVPESQRRY